jgi:cytochrome c-type biogenesis protein CcsB
MCGLLPVLAGLVLAGGFAHGALPGPSVSGVFVEQLDLSRFRLAAVQDAGRVKTLDAHAREKLKHVHPGLGAAFDPVLLYLDMALVPQHWMNQPVIEIKKKAFRRQFAGELRAALGRQPGHAGGLTAAEIDRIEAEGTLTPRQLDHPLVRQVLSVLERDLMRTAKEVRRLENARALADARILRSLLQVVPPPEGDPLDPWLSLDAAAYGGMPRDATHDAIAATATDPRLSADRSAQLRESWEALEEAWRFQDAAAAGVALDTLATTLSQIEPALYPSLSRRSWESWYYANRKLTDVWLIYFAALVPLLMALVYGIRWARRVGLALFAVAFALHTFSIGLRWYLAGRIPNANMFEAITAAAWFGCLTALVLELVLRRWPLKNVPALAASAAAAVALMFGRFHPVLVGGSDIETVMPVLDRTIWLYIHTNIVIASYALIFFGAVTGTLYLVLWAVQRWRPVPALTRAWMGQYGVGAAGGGAAALILGRGMRQGEASEVGLARTLDAATMIFLELAFISLWFGTILGAVWADVSWGRPWGWDPKEVFALNTWLVFLVLVHVRLRVRRKALWTAVLAVVGCAVMLFNWIAVNFVIVGLHSYA